MGNNEYPGTLLAWVTGMPHTTLMVQSRASVSLLSCASYPHRTQGITQLKSYTQALLPLLAQ